MRKMKVFGLYVCAVMLVVASVLGTLAYLTAQDKVTNTFTVGKVDITLDETKVTPDGVPVNGAARVKENNYHLIPGMTYVKDPTMTVLEGSEESYVRLLVTVNRYTELTAIFGDPFLPQNFVTGWDQDVWVSTKVIDVDANTATYEFRYYQTVDASDADVSLDALFDTIVLPGNVTGEQLKTISDMEINVVGHAIQKAGFADADAAWNAFDEQV